MKSDRPGDFLWQEWEGSGYDPQIECSVIYYTFDHIDLDNDLVRRALASALQRDGVAISLGDGFNLIDKCLPNYWWTGIIEDEEDYSICDEFGETEYGEFVDSILPATWIEI
jgi:ABC-type transport system substrate-binding protein